MTSTLLASKHCAPCNGQMPLLSAQQIADFAKELHVDWQLSEDSSTLERKFVFKGYAKATYLTNLCVWLADKEGHHPDIAFGWGYCHVSLSTHDVSGLTENDFIWAARLDVLTG